MHDTTPALSRLPAVFSLPEAVDAGLSRAVVERLVRGGGLNRPLHGVYTRHPAHEADTPHWQRVRTDHLRRATEHLATRPGHALSHHSAALQHDLPVHLHPDTDVHLTSIERVPRSRRRTGLQLHHSDSMDNETEMVDGLRVTTLPRTLADLLRTMRPRNSVPLVDHAVRSGHTGLDLVRDTLEAQRRWRGRPRAVEALRWADPLRESWLESYSFVTLAESGLELPLAQVEVFDQMRVFVARLDGLCRRSGVALECDGFDKYLIAHRRDHLSAEESTARALVAQNERQRGIEQLGLRVVRWTSGDITQRPDDVVGAVAEACRNHSLAHFTGWLRIQGVWVRP